VTSRSIAAAAVLGLLAACAGAEPRPPAPPAREARPAAPAAAPAPAPKAAPSAPAPTAPDASGAAASALSPRAQRLFEEAVRAEEEQKKLKVPTDWAYVERKWRAVLDEAEVAEARFNLGVALEAQGRLSDARAEYERARDDKPSLRQAWSNLGVLLEKQGDAREAAALYARIARDFPEDAVSRERLAALYRASGQLDDAWRLAREALVREPRSPGAYKVLVRVALQRNDLDLAMLVALRAQKLDPADPELPFFAGQVLARQGNDAQAAVQFQKALALQPGFLPARYALLDGALKKQAWGPVAEQAAAILKAEPGNAALHLALGVAQRHLGKTDEALASYAQAQKLGGDKLPEVHLARGVLLARVKSDCEPALEELRAYQRAAGAALADGGQVVKLQRECEQMLEENRKAMEAAKQMQAEAAKQAAEQAAKAKTVQPAGADGGASPTPAPRPQR
jgi:tetratricopeptide (TPR) repeat protein